MCDARRPLTKEIFLWSNLLNGGDESRFVWAKFSQLETLRDHLYIRPKRKCTYSMPNLITLLEAQKAQKSDRDVCVGEFSAFWSSLCFVYPLPAYYTTAALNNERARCSRGSFSQYAHQHYLLIFYKPQHWLGFRRPRLAYHNLCSICAHQGDGQAPCRQWVRETQYCDDRLLLNLTNATPEAGLTTLSRVLINWRIPPR